MEQKMKILYVYKVDHDLGMNPNPFGVDANLMCPPIAQEMCHNLTA